MVGSVLADILVSFCLDILVTGRLSFSLAAGGVAGKWSVVAIGAIVDADRFSERLAADKLLVSLADAAEDDKCSTFLAALGESERLIFSLVASGVADRILFSLEDSGVAKRILFSLEASEEADRLLFSLEDSGVAKRILLSLEASEEADRLLFSLEAREEADRLLFSLEASEVTVRLLFSLEARKEAVRLLFSLEAIELADRLLFSLADSELADRLIFSLAASETADRLLLFFSFEANAEAERLPFSFEEGEEADSLSDNLAACELAGWFLLSPAAGGEVGILSFFFTTGGEVVFCADADRFLFSAPSVAVGTRGMSFPCGGGSCGIFVWHSTVLQIVKISWQEMGGWKTQVIQLMKTCYNTLHLSTVIQQTGTRQSHSSSCKQRRKKGNIVFSCYSGVILTFYCLLSSPIFKTYF